MSCLKFLHILRRPLCNNHHISFLYQSQLHEYWYSVCHIRVFFGFLTHKVFKSWALTKSLVYFVILMYLQSVAWLLSHETTGSSFVLTWSFQTFWNYERFLFSPLPNLPPIFILRCCNAMNFSPSGSGQLWNHGGQKQSLSCYGRERGGCSNQTSQSSATSQQQQTQLVKR